MELLKKGDKVVMHTCLEAETYNGKIWTCEGDEFTKGKEKYYQENVVFLEGFSGYFCTKFLQKVNVEGIVLKNIDLTGISRLEQGMKADEELEEFREAFIEYRENPTEENKLHVIEEWWDRNQAELGILEKEGITAEELQEYYPKHLEKLKNRPRSK